MNYIDFMQSLTDDQKTFFLSYFKKLTFDIEQTLDFAFELGKIKTSKIDWKEHKQHLKVVTNKY